MLYRRFGIKGVIRKLHDYKHNRCWEHLEFRREGRLRLHEIVDPLLPLGVQYKNKRL